MKTLLVPALFGVCLLTVLPFAPADAQMSFSPGQMPNANPAFSRANTSSASLPPVAPATAVPGTATGAQAGAYPATGYSSEPIDPDHKLNHGDLLSYRVIEDRDPTIIPLQVTDSGEVNVPLINRVKAAGKTTEQLAADIKSKLEQEYYYHATVVLGLTTVAPRPSRGTVYITGAVRSVGAVELPLDADLTVSQAIAKTGGFTDFANKKGVRVIRKGGPPRGYNVDVGAVLKGNLDKDFKLQQGDQVVVPEKMFNM